MTLAVKAATRQRHRQRILPVLVHIEENLHRPLRLEALAARAGFSPFHFHRVFAEVVGESPMTYIRRLRLERAVYRMKVSPDNVLQIGLEAGFQSHESFTRAFVRFFDMKPSEFRAMLKEFRRCLKQAFGDYEDWTELEGPAIRLSDPDRQPGFRIERFPGRELIFKRYRGRYAELLGREANFEDLWTPLFGHAEEQDLSYDREQLIGICHDDPYVTDEGKIRFDACLVVEAPSESTEEIGRRRLPEADCVVRRHFKGFEEIENTFAFIGVEWLPARGYLLQTRPPFELYQCQEIQGQLVRVASDAYVPLKPIR